MGVDRCAQAENEELRQGQMALAGELRNLRQQMSTLQAAVSPHCAHMHTGMLACTRLHNAVATLPDSHLLPLMMALTVRQGPPEATWLTNV